ncbi:MAG: enoyl-CoA hydratase/isomerase family protein [Alphaproteobacteria bacterium]|nr:enoyl-CoA hydratase/isomerase family protein [Alphaproteobacteria bacterium]
MSAESNDLLVAREDGIVTLTLNRPDKLNAMTLGLWRRLGEAVRALDADDAVRCIVLRGAGERAFSPGNDIAEFATERSTVEQGRAYGEVMHATLHALADCRHPLVAMIQGICVGGGLELACLCDLRICGESSRFGAPVARLGLVMAHDEMAAMVSLVGRAAALEILLEGRVFGADEALQKGLVSRVVADAAVADEAYAAARRVAAGAPLVHRWHKRFARRLEEPRPLSAEERDEAFACYGTRDFQTGYRAFLAKAEPQFEGK